MKSLPRSRSVVDPIETESSIVTIAELLAKTSGGNQADFAWGAYAALYREYRDLLEQVERSNDEFWPADADDVARLDDRLDELDRWLNEPALGRLDPDVDNGIYG